MNIGLGIGIPFAKSQIWLSLFDPSKLFTAGVNGVWYDPSDITTLYRDAAGTLPVTAVEQPVGFMLDKSKPLVLGPELVTNGDFSNGTTGWSAVGSTLTVVSGKLNVATTGTNQGASQTITFAAGKTYRVNVDVTHSGVDYNILFGFAFGQGQMYSTGRLSTSRTVSFCVTPGASSWMLSLFSYDAGNVQYDNISVRELPGNHAFNSSGNSANFPVLSARYNLLVGTETLATQNVTTAATTQKLTFTGTGSITLSGTATGTYSAGTNSITTTAGTLTLTVSGSVTKADLRASNDALNQPAYQRVNTATDYDTVGFKPAEVFDGVDDNLIASAGGGSTTAFFWCSAIRVGKVGAVQTLFSDAGTNTGYRVRINASNQLELSAGNGTAYTTVATTATLSIGQRAVLTAWHDGTNLNVQINNGTVHQAAFATATAGTAQFTIGKDNNAASNFFAGRLYEKVYTKDNVPSSAQITSTKTYVANVAGITLS